jgi:hypothetical protein
MFIILFSCKAGFTAAKAGQHWPVLSEFAARMDAGSARVIK